MDSLDRSERGALSSLPVPIFNENAIQAATQAIQEIECSIYALELVCKPDGGDIPNEVFSKALVDKRNELIWVKKKLNELYELQLLHLRASILDCQRQFQSFPIGHWKWQELKELISKLHIKTEAAWNAKSQL
jgi:hypothetical protein